MKWGLALCLVASPVLSEETTDASGALLRGLDKVTGVATDLELATGSSLTFGRLVIDLGNCRYPAADPSSNAYAHLTIHDLVVSAPVFDGWMVAASPALNALDHPRYDVWLLRCMTPAADGG